MVVMRVLFMNCYLPNHQYSFYLYYIETIYKYFISYFVSLGTKKDKYVNYRTKIPAIF